MAPVSGWAWLVLAGAGTGEAGSWTINKSGSALHWEQSEIPWQLNPHGKHGLRVDDVEEAVVAAASEWNLEGAWVELVYEGRTDVQAPEREDEVQAVFFTDEWPETLSPDLLALTYVWSYESGDITHFDIAVNTDGHAWGVGGEADRNDLQNALTHEFGHAMGLDHSTDGEATMFHQTTVGEVVKRELAEDDVETFSSVYGGTYPFEFEETLEKMGCASAGSGHRQSAGLALLAGLAALGARRRRPGQGAG